MVRRRRNQAHARGGVARFRNPRVHLAGGQVAALAGFRALRHLDLDLLRADEITAGYAKASAGHLLDRGAAIVIRSGGSQTVVALAALAAVGLAVQMVHGDRQGLMRFL